VIAGCGNRGGVLGYVFLNSAIAPINTWNFIFGGPNAARPIFVDTNGGAITGGVNPAQLASRPGTKLLILHHHNAPFPQAEVVDINPPISIAAGGDKARARIPIALR
jgi:hypothetical protein